MLSKWLRVVVRSRSIQRCTRMIRGVWVLASQNKRLRSRAQRGGGMFWSFKRNSKKCGMLRGWCFIGTQNFKLKHIKRCELWKRQNQCWIVPNSNVTIQGGICLFHSSHLVMFFNLKFCVAIKHHLLNIPHFFRFLWNFKIWLPQSFHWISAFVSEPCAIWKHFVRRISVFKSP